MVRLTAQLVWWTRAIVFVAAVSAVVSFLQFVELRSQVSLARSGSIDTQNAIAATNRIADLTRDANAGAQSNASIQRIQTKTALDISYDQLDTTRKSAKDTSTLSKSGERAWVTPILTVVTFNRDAKTGTFALFHAHWMNTGRTPAQKVYARISGNGRTVADKETRMGSIIGPSQDFTTNYIAIDVEEAFVTRKSYVVESTITYRDIFSEKIRHSLARYNVRYIGLDDPANISDLHKLLGSFEIGVLETTGD